MLTIVALDSDDKSFLANAGHKKILVGKCFHTENNFVLEIHFGFSKGALVNMNPKLQPKDDGDCNMEL